MTVSTQRAQFGEDPAVGQRELLARRQHVGAGQAFVERDGVAQRVPELGREALRLVAVALVEAQLLRLQAHLAQDAEARAVGAVLGHEIGHRVDRVAERFGHLAALHVEHQRRDEHRLERHPPTKRRPSITMRDTHRKMMSRLVIITWLGYQCSSSGVRSGQPRIENGHRPEENQVSSVSGSRRSSSLP